MPPEKLTESVAYSTAPENRKPSLERSVRGGTVQDKRDMWRVGRDQELNVPEELIH